MLLRNGDKSEWHLLWWYHLTYNGVFFSKKSQLTCTCTINNKNASFLLKIIFKHDLAQWETGPRLLEQKQKAPNDVRNESDLRRAANTKCKWGCLLKHKSYIIWLHYIIIPFLTPWKVYIYRHFSKTGRQFCFLQ